MNLQCFNPSCRAVTPHKQRKDFDFTICGVCNSVNVKPTAAPIRFPHWYNGGKSTPVYMKRKTYRLSKKVG